MKWLLWKSGGSNAEIKEGRYKKEEKKKRSYELNQKSVGDTRYLEMEG
jgi:hypothetical protein